MFRSHTCGQLRSEHVGKEVMLAGWVARRRDHGGVIFIDLRDMFGLTQVTFHPDTNKAAWEAADKLRNEYVVTVKGLVEARPKEMINKNLATGDIEIVATEVKVLNTSKPLPFEIDVDKYS